MALTLPQIGALQRANAGYWIDPSNGRLFGPKVFWEPVEPEASTQAFITPRSQILHSNAAPKKTPWYSLRAYWYRKDITGEAHFQVDLDGTIHQAIPSVRKADCNAKANRWKYNGQYYGAISYETQDEGAAALPTTPWYPEQFEALVGALTAHCVTFGLDCDTVTEWTDGGIDYHSKFKEWSIYVGKTCPGYQRIQQVDELRRQVSARVVAFHQLCQKEGL